MFSYVNFFLAICWWKYLIVFLVSNYVTNISIHFIRLKRFLFLNCFFTNFLWIWYYFQHSNFFLKNLNPLLVIAYVKRLLIEIHTITKFLLFKMKYVIDWGCRFDYWRIILLRYPNTLMKLYVRWCGVGHSICWCTGNDDFRYGILRFW